MLKVEALQQRRQVLRLRWTDAWVRGTQVPQIKPVICTSYRPRGTGFAFASN
jgi:hypothetical protein